MRRQLLTIAAIVCLGIFGFARQGYPEVGNQYVLFLKRDEEGDFSIVTGYDVSSPGVTPLDGDARQPRGDLQFGIYRGMAKDSFLIELHRAVTATMI